MNRTRFDSRELVLGTLDEIGLLSPPSVPFAILIAAGPASPTPEQRRLIEGLAAPNCREMCFAGLGGERLHDHADEVVEARGLLNIVTTWLTDETPSEVGFYFVRVAGGMPPLLLAPVDHERSIAAALMEAVSDRSPRRR